MAASYPEHDKLIALGDDRDTIQHFLDWLDEQGVTLAVYGQRNGYDDPPRNENRLYALREGRHPLIEKFPGRHVFEQIMAAYFDIDLDKISAEKDEMLAAIRDAQK